MLLRGELSMKIATILFVYNRSWHTKKTLESLSKNDILPQKLFVFQDGLKKEEHRSEWENVNNIIHAIDWCNNEVVERKSNLGLAQSIVQGITYVMQDYDAVIVLEDDCVTHPKFMSFVMKALQKYKGDHNVYQVSGYAWPVVIKKNGSDGYFAGRMSSWGWATWRDRWKEYKQDYNILSRIKNDMKLTEQFSVWGEDLEYILYSNMNGKANSWAVFWALLIIEKGGYCLNPYESLVDNIGLDGSGVHCAVKKMKKNMRSKNNLQEFILPDLVEFPEDYEYSFIDMFSWKSEGIKASCYNKVLLQWIELEKTSKNIPGLLEKKGISRIAIWGKGDISKLLIEKLDGKIEITSIIESEPNIPDFLNIPVIELEYLPVSTQLIVVIPIYDFVKIKKKIDRLSSCRAIPLDKLLNMTLKQDF